MNNIILTTGYKRQSIRESIALGFVDIFKPLYFLLRKNKKTWTVTMDDLRQMPMGTLGNEVYHFLRQNNLQLMPKAEVHDVHHVLFEFGTNIHDETCIQFLPLGNGRRTIPYLASTFVALILYPEYWIDFYRIYRRGKRANHFHDWDFEPLLSLKTVNIRRMIFQKD